MGKYIVYVKKDSQNRITAVNSSEFLTNTNGWTAIDEGYGDKYHHSQNNYFPMPITDERGICRYKLEDGKAIERSQAEMDAEYVEHDNQPSDTDRISTLETKLAAYEAAYAEGVNEA